MLRLRRTGSVEMDTEKIFKEIVKIVRKYLSDDYKILLFGSWAKGDFLNTSDVDIAILGDNKVPYDLMVKIKEEVEEIPTLRSIDIIDLNSKEKAFRENVLRYAKSL